MDPTPGTVLSSKYRIDRPLARGGMGAVWVGRHLALDVPIAIKFMSPSAADEASARARFAREARASASLRSPHVVQIIDFDAQGPAPYIVMELLEGEDLGRRLAKRRKLLLAEVAGIVEELATGLALAHDAGIVHRDLKPSNIFLARIGADEIVKVLDFGVAKETRIEGNETETTTGVVVGSPSYMSPEQARGGKLDARSDLWSVGVLVFQALTGRRPFEGENLGDVLVRICSDPLPAATSLADELPIEVDRFFDRALCRSPDGRFQDARALARALSEIALTADSGSSKTLDELGPRADVTGSIAAAVDPREQPTAAHGVAALTDAGAPSDAGATLEARAVRIPPTIEVARLDPPRVDRAPDVTTVGAEAVVPRAAPERRGWLWGVAGAALVAALWGASQSGLFKQAGVAAPPTSAPSPTASAPEASAAPITDPTASATAAVTTAVESASVVSAAPSASTPVVASQRSAPLRVPVNRPRAGAAPHVDPKFGLPVPKP